MSANKTHKVLVISAKAERIAATDKIKCIITAAALDIEDNFLPLEAMDIYVNNKLVDTTISDASGELTMTLQLDYNADTELMVQAEHKASGQKSPKKLLSVWEGKKKKKKEDQREQEIVIQTEKQIPEVYTSPISKWAAIVAVRQNGLLLGDIKYTHLIDDIAIVTEAVKQNGLALEFASERLKKDIEIFNIAVEQNEDAALFAEENLYKSYKTALEDARLNGNITPQFNDTRNLVILAIKTDTNNFKSISDRLKDDESIVKLAVEKEGSLLQYASLRLRKDRDIVLLATQNTPSAILYVDITIQADESIVLWIIKKDPNLLKDLLKSIKNSWWIGMVAVQKNWLLLQYLSEQLKNNKDIVLAAIKQNGLALQFASERLKDDKDVVLIAVRQNGLALQFASERLKDDKWLVVNIIQNNYLTIRYISDDLRSTDADIIYIRLKNWEDPSIIPRSLADNKNFMLNFITNSEHWTLKYASERLLQDADIVLAEIKKGNAYLDRDPSDRAKEDFLKTQTLYTFFYKNWSKHVIRLCHMHMFVWHCWNNIEIALALIKNDHLNISKMRSYRTRVKKVMIEVVKHQRNLDIVHSDLKNDPDIRKAAWIT